MKIENNIGWCDATTNAVTGCDKVSAGCRECYAQKGTRARVLRAQGIETWGPKGVRHPVKEFAAKLRRLNKLCICDRCHVAWPVIALAESYRCLEKGVCHACKGPLRRIRLFADSNSDWLDEKWSVETLVTFLTEISEAPNVDVLLLTKRPENIVSRLNSAITRCRSGVSAYSSTPMIRWLEAWNVGNPPKNLWLGVSVENQAMAVNKWPTPRASMAEGSTGGYPANPICGTPSEVANAPIAQPHNARSRAYRGRRKEI